MKTGGGHSMNCFSSECSDLQAVINEVDWTGFISGAITTELNFCDFYAMLWDLVITNTSLQKTFVGFNMAISINFPLI
jgi:hypothetical protein